MSSLRTIILQPTSLCNLNCKYCYISEQERQNSRKIEFNLLEEIIEKIFKTPSLNNSVQIIWHAGEPLTAGIPFYEKATAIINKYKPPHIEVVQLIQTNGTLIDEKWCRFIKLNNFKIGVSIDGPEHIHNKNRVNWAQKGTFNATLKGIKALQKNEINFEALMVISNYSLDYPDEIINFFLDLNIEYLGFNIEELTSNNVSSSLLNDNLVIVTKYKQFMRRFIELWLENSSRIKIREFERLSAYIIKKIRSPNFVAPQIESSKEGIISINKTGGITAFSPDLASGIPGDTNFFMIENIKNIPDLSYIYEEDAFKRMYNSIRVGVDLCKQSCQYFDLCGGGRPTNKYFEHGTFAASETNFCKFYYQYIINILLEKYSNVECSKLIPVQSGML